jgi:transglutaminase-like putative cysteine protease
MKFGRAHRILTIALAALGILAVAGTMPLPGTAPLQLVIELLVLAQVAMLVTARDAAHDNVVFGLALVHFLTAAVLGGGLALMTALAGLVLVLPAALVLSHLRREVECNYQQGARDRTGSPVDVPRILRSRRVMSRGMLAALAALALPLLAITVVVFVLVPRVAPHALSTSWLDGLGGDRGALVHFSDSVDLGKSGALSPDDSVALRFRVAHLAEPAPAHLALRFRGAVLEDFDGTRFTRVGGESGAGGASSAEARNLALAERAHEPDATAITIEREPFDPSLTFLPVGAVSWHLLEGASARHYVAYVSAEAKAPPEGLAEQARAHDLALPQGISPRITELAHAWADREPTTQAKARAIEQHLKTELAYDLAAPSRGKKAPVDDFLFATKRGHCELFASSLVVMLRAIGIPAREITGFLGGTYNRYGDYYVVKQRDAHAWVEAYVENGAAPAWLTFDPTPSAPAPAPASGVLADARDFGDAAARSWGNGVVSYDRHAQTVVLAALRFPLAVATALAVAVLMVFGLRSRGRDSGFSRWWRARFRFRSGSRTTRRDREQRVDTDEATALYVTLENALVSHGIVRDVAVPPLAHAEDLVRRQHPLATEVAILTRLYLEARFGGRRLTGDARREFARGLTRVVAFQSA